MFLKDWLRRKRLDGPRRCRDAADALAGTSASRASDELSGKGLFVVGCARSGTTILAVCLNLAEDVHILFESDVFINHGREGFVEWFNGVHEGYHAVRRKGTCAPSAPPGTPPGGLPFLAWLSKGFRYVGEKVTFGPHGKWQGRHRQELFFEFHMKHFYQSRYILIIRSPTEVAWSMSKMWPDRDVNTFFETWLRTADVLIDVYQTFPHTRVLFFEDFGPEAVDRISRMIDIDVRFREEMLKDDNRRSRLGPYKAVCRKCEDIHRGLKEAFDVESLRYVCNDNPGRFFAGVKAGIAAVLREVVAA
ncbi:MAG: hypothetical protein ACYS9X_30185 [Planctomycetota bacterium]|jgi:hypothetical protein